MLELPSPITGYFSAANSDDAARVASYFSDDAIVRDERQTIRGAHAVRAWAEETRRKYRYHAEVVASEEATDRTIVTAHVTGDFPGSPIDLRYRFKLVGPKIAELDIG
jgi:ketosteroid isomerase-like protein